MKNLDYITADLVSPWADVKFDVHDIPLLRIIVLMLLYVIMF